MRRIGTGADAHRRRCAGGDDAPLSGREVHRLAVETRDLSAECGRFPDKLAGHASGPVALAMQPRVFWRPARSRSPRPSPSEPRCRSGSPGADWRSVAAHPPSDARRDCCRRACTGPALPPSSQSPLINVSTRSHELRRPCHPRNWAPPAAHAAHPMPPIPSCPLPPGHSCYPRAAHESDMRGGSRRIFKRSAGRQFPRKG